MVKEIKMCVCVCVCLNLQYISYCNLVLEFSEKLKVPVLLLCKENGSTDFTIVICQ